MAVQEAAAEGGEVVSTDREAPDAGFLAQLLRVAADDGDLDPGELEFAVITGGSRYCVVRKPGGGTAVEKGPAVKYWPFEKGEIIVLPKDGYRGPFGEGRSVAKWDVSYEQFGRDYVAAKRCSDEVKAAPDRDLFA